MVVWGDKWEGKYAPIIALEVHLFEKGNHPAMLSNQNAFFEITKEKIK